MFLWSGSKEGWNPRPARPPLPAILRDISPQQLGPVDRRLFCGPADPRNRSRGIGPACGSEGCCSCFSRWTGTSVVTRTRPVRPQQSQRHRPTPRAGRLPRRLTSMTSSAVSCGGTGTRRRWRTVRNGAHCADHGSTRHAASSPLPRQDGCSHGRSESRARPRVFALRTETNNTQSLQHDVPAEDRVDG